jgi:GNAT superfamily N-acetyltransferase
VSDDYRCEQLAARHNRVAFSCGSAELDRYFRQQVTQDIRRRVTSCFVALPSDGDAIAGYYTLASAAIPLSDLPADLVRRLPHYPSLPAVRIGRLAVDERFRGRGVGGLLLFDAATRAAKVEQANFTILVDAKDDTAAAFYRHHGFAAFANSPRTLFLPLETAAKLFGSRSQSGQ